MFFCFEESNPACFVLFWMKSKGWSRDVKLGRTLGTVCWVGLGWFGLDAGPVLRKCTPNESTCSLEIV